ncbi:MAG: ABC transporter permease [Candidatus Methanomethylophilaceae archaeon]|nr:ABC transporter permease [Candidatus Methanomethylophilaceae archaeon]
MNDVLALTKRQSLCYFRDKASVFFSLMGVLIVILLYLIFLRDMLVDSFLSDEHLAMLDKSVVRQFVDAWVLSGILAIVSVITSAGALQNMVQDKVTGRERDFMITSLTPAKISAAYVLSTFIVAQIMSLISFVIAIVYLAVTGCPMTIEGILLTLVLTVPASLSGSIIVYAMTCRLRSGGAFSGLFTVLSVLIGFLTGIYMPLGTMAEGMRNIGSLMPATHIAALMRQALSTESLNNVMGSAPQEEYDRILFMMGCKIELFGIEFTPAMSVIYVIAVTVAFFGLAVLLSKKK